MKKWIRFLLIILILVNFVMHISNLDFVKCKETIATIGDCDRKLSQDMYKPGRLMFVRNPVLDKLSKDMKLLQVHNGCYLMADFDMQSNETDEILKVNIHYFDSDGQSLWSVEVEEWCYLHYYRIIGEKLVLACDRIIYLINLKDGQIIWKKNDYLPEEYYISIASSDEMLFIACDSSCVAIDLEDGSKVWEVAQDFAGSSGFRRSMAYSSDKLVIYSNGLFCFDANNGKMLWSREMSFDSITKNSMVMDDERVYVDDLRFNQISAVDLSTGKTIWTTSYSLKYSLAYPLLLKGDYLFLQGYGVFDSTTGKLLWSDWYKNYDKSIIVGNVLLSHMDTRCSIFAEEYTYTSLRARDVRNAKVLWCKDIKNTNWNNNLWLMNDNKIYYDDLVSTSCIQPAANKISFNIGSDKGIVDDCLMISMDTKPVIYQNRSFLPAKYVVESLGGFIEWNSDERKVECKLVSIKNPNDRIPAGYNEHVVELWIDKPTAKVNGVETQIDPNNPEVVPTIIDGRTMVPMRFLAESLGCEVEWIAETKEIVLTYTN